MSKESQHRRMKWHCLKMSVDKQLERMCSMFFMTDNALYLHRCIASKKKVGDRDDSICVRTRNDFSHPNTAFNEYFNSYAE